jgi:hypothetical protein
VRAVDGLDSTSSEHPYRLLAGTASLRARVRTFSLSDNEIDDGTKVGKIEIEKERESERERERERD